MKKINKILIIGAGKIAIEYSKILDELKVIYKVIGRSEGSALKFYSETGIMPFVGGLNRYLENPDEGFNAAIVAVDAIEHFNVISLLINNHFEKILVEKPGALSVDELKEMVNKQLSNQEIFIAYNRRFYATTLKAIEFIKEDNGVKSFSFEFTELSHQISKLNKPSLVKARWFLANSTHVVDLAFYLGGTPKELVPFHADKIDWHSSGAIFTGAGVTSSNAIFNYHANWKSPGRWGLELFTSNRKIILRPLEKLFIQETGSFDINEFTDIDYTLDKKYKPGFFLQTKAFINGETENMLTIKKQLELFYFYNKIANY